MASALRHWPPGGEAYSASALWAALRTADPEAELLGALRGLLGGRATLHASGREAMRVAVTRLAQRSGRDEIVVPAYTCFSIPASVVAAGLRVRLVDVTPDARIDVAALDALPLERAAALVVGNLFGVPEPATALRERISSAGVALIDDAAQSLGARTREGPAGARGDLGILSFGRGKPLCGLGGGAIVWPAATELETSRTRPDHGRALARAIAYDVALEPAVFRWLASIPALGIGETRFDPAFATGPIDGASLCLAAIAQRSMERLGRERARRAESLAGDIAAASAFSPIRAEAGTSGVYPRLAVVAPSAQARDFARSALRHLGASGMYPDALDRLAPLRPHLAGDASCPVARELAARLLTLPTHREIRGSQREKLLDILGRLS